VVIRLVYRSRSFLFMGDADAEVEDLLIRSYGEFLRSDVLKVGHHGSPDGSTVPFLELVRPEWAVVSVGMFNTFGHPSAEVIERLRRFSGCVARTDLDGALLLSTDGVSLRRLEWR
jgi:beta-lactamase superfamily II metal-dependent hydrolase